MTADNNPHAAQDVPMSAGDDPHGEHNARGQRQERAAVEGWTPPTAGQRRRILTETRTVAVVGASSNRSRASNFVITYLLSSADYELFLVNPRETEICGLPAYPDLEALPEVPDMVDVFRRSEDLPEIAEQAAGIGSRVFWAQLGLWSLQAAGIAAGAGLEVVMDRCLKIEHARFHGGLHLAGFDTGVIDSRR